MCPLLAARCVTNGNTLDWRKLNDEWVGLKLQTGLSGSVRKSLDATMITIVATI
jgi:hypothetical protein